MPMLVTTCEPRKILRMLRDADRCNATTDSGPWHERTSSCLPPDPDRGGPRRRVWTMGSRGGFAISHPTHLMGGHGLVTHLAHPYQAWAVDCMRLRISRGVWRGVDSRFGPITRHLQTTVMPNRRRTD